MRFAHSVVAVCILLLLAVPSWGKRPPQSSSTPASDPQAVAVVQAAITALGGATTIGQFQSWDLQGTGDGPLSTGSSSDTIKLQLVNPTVTVSGASRSAPRFLGQSLFVPALASVILAQESQSANFIMRYDGTSTLAGNSVAEVTFVDAGSQAIAQIWVFNTANNLPARVLFELPAQVGRATTVRGVVDLSGYTAISGVMYPLSIVTYVRGNSPETLTIQTVTPSGAVASQTGSTTGGAQ